MQINEILALTNDIGAGLSMIVYSARAIFTCTFILYTVMLSSHVNKGKQLLWLHGVSKGKTEYSSTSMAQTPLGP